MQLRSLACLPLQHLPSNRVLDRRWPLLCWRNGWSCLGQPVSSALSFEPLHVRLNHPSTGSTSLSLGCSDSSSSGLPSPAWEAGDWRDSTSGRNTSGGRGMHMGRSSKLEQGLHYHAKILHRIYVLCLCITRPSRNRILSFALVSALGAAFQRSTSFGAAGDSTGEFPIAHQFPLHINAMVQRKSSLGEISAPLICFLRSVGSVVGSVGLPPAPLALSRFVSLASKLVQDLE